MSRFVPHVPMRPLWRCRACGAHWPCQPARLALLVEYREDRTALLIYLGALMAEAGDQLAQLNGHARPTDLHERFLGWARARTARSCHRGMLKCRTMDASRLHQCLVADARRLRAVAAEDLTAAVPTCPGWTVADLVTHVAAVYLHKVEAMRLNRQPAPWPPEFSGERPLALFDRAYAALLAEFDARQPGDPAYTFDERDQSVGFWLRRMAHETAIHRVDAELARRAPVTPVTEDLAVDGIDEVLTLFMDHGSHRWPEEFAEALRDWNGQRVVVVGTGSASWRVEPSATAVDVTAGSGDRPADATLSGAPDPVQRWLWGRAPDSAVELHGDPQVMARFRRLLTIATQ